MLKYNLYFQDILRAISLIEKSIGKKSFETFKKNPDLIDANCMRIQIIGESISKLPESLRKKFNEVDWEKFLRTRNIISHAYFAVNTEIIWSLVKKYLPKLKKQIKQIIIKLG